MGESVREVEGEASMRGKAKPSALVLFSGGLDSLLAVKVLQGQGVRVEAVHFTCPFYRSGAAREGARRLGVRLHEVRVDASYFRMVAEPRHGYGSRMNPCIDCKAYMIRRAERLRRRLGLGFLATGEVLGERPMSQNRRALSRIEEEAGLEGNVVRPLSGSLLPPTRAEERGLIRREGLLGIRGRSRKPQMRLARELGVREYPAPAGGCLLTDPEYARRLREHLDHEGSVSWEEGELLRLGRHFRVGKSRVVVGRNQEENEAMLELARRMRLAVMEVLGHPGPVTLLVPKGRPGQEVLEAAAGLTVRYSDAEGSGPEEVQVRRGRSRSVIRAKAIPGERLEELRI